MAQPNFIRSIQGIALLIPLLSRILIIIWELLLVSVHLRNRQLLPVPAQLRLPLASIVCFLHFEAVEAEFFNLASNVAIYNF